MDKFEKVIKLTENPGNFSPEQCAEILADPEAREIYNLLCKTKSALAGHGATPDPEAEWERFSAKAFRPSNPFGWFGSRAASVSGLILISVAALAIGVAVTVQLTAPKHAIEPCAEEDALVASTSAASEANVLPADSVRILTAPVLFEDDSLANILSEIAKNYNVGVHYDTDNAEDLRLYYRFDPALPLEAILEQLNTFEQIDLHFDGKNIIVR